MNNWLASCLFLAGAAISAPAEVFRLDEPEVYKITWETQSLLPWDLNGDGRTDLGLINKKEGKIELFMQLAPGQKAKTKKSNAKDRWEPVLEDSRFERAKIFTSSGANDLGIGDINGDGLADIVYTNDRDEIVAHLQGKEGDWSQRTVTELGVETRNGPETIWIGDLDKDKSNDLVLMAKDKLLVFAKANLKDKPRSFPLPESAIGLVVRDANGDGLLDLLYTNGTSDDHADIVVRLQNAKRGFVQEQAFEIDAPTQSAQNLNWPGGVSLVSISQGQSTIQRYTLSKAEAGAEEKALRKAAFQASGYAVPGTKEAKFAVGDFNGDKRIDVAASDGPGAQIWLFLQNENSQFDEPENFPALAEISSLTAADFDGDGRSELVMASSKESQVGLSRYGEDKRLSYPATLPIKSTPLSVTAGDLDGDAKAEIIALTEGKTTRDRMLVILHREGTEWKADEPKEVKLKAQELRIGDLNQDGKADLLLLSAADAMGALLQKSDGGFADVDASGTPGLGEKIAPSSVSFGDFDNDGKPELLVSRNNYTRCVRIDANGKAQVVDQVNAPEASASVLVSHVIDLDGDNKPELLLIDAHTSKIHVMARDEKGVFRLRESQPNVGDIVGSLVTDGNGDGHSDLLLFTKTHFWWRPFLPGGLTLNETRLYVTDLKEVTQDFLLSTELDGDGKDDLVAIDSEKSNIMEILLTGEGTEQEPLRSAMHFKLFERDPHFRGQEGTRAQPHEMISADLNSDGKRDLIMLMHDRLLIYSQSAKLAEGK